MNILQSIKNPFKGKEKKKKRTAFDIGKEGTAKEIAVVMNAKVDGWHSDRRAVAQCAMGAVEVFRAGKPENLRSVISGDYKERPYFVACMVQSMALKADEIGQAFETVTPEVKQDLLNQALSMLTHKSAIEEIVKAGADVHAGEENALRHAVNYGRTDVVGVLHDLGADFDRAILYNSTHEESRHMVRHLRAYQTYFEKKPARQKESDLIREMRAEIRALTEKVDKLEKAQGVDQASQPKPPSPSGV
ncbi:MAG: hypothetical protein OXT65_07215 [Alphaproteobacteria bacterium]|nr:hypothetical protein [Alphaproteobacteria bacterium]